MKLRDRRSLKAAAVFVLCFGFLLAITRTLVFNAHFFAYAVPIRESVQRFLPARALSTLGWYGNELDHAALLFDFGGVSSKTAKSADILIMGNSRTQFAFPSESLREFSRITGRRIYNLAVGNNERGKFPLEIIRKYDLHPKTAVVNVDGFFHDRFSDYGAEVVKSGEWSNKKEFFEQLSSYWVYPALAEIFPNFVSGTSNYLLFRDPENGAWVPQHLPVKRFPIPKISKTDLSAEYEDPFLAEFLTEMKSRDVRVILTWIPGPKPSYVIPLGAKFGLEVVAPYPDQLLTFDESHMDPVSGKKFSEAFFAELKF
jgi:hypothetical protein